MHKVKPKKSLGQHFLTDKNIAKKIVGSLSGTNYNSVLEVGPGTGVLTEFLLQSNSSFYAYEIDSESIEHLKKTYPENDFIIEQDILKADFSFISGPIALIGNLPYYISSQIFFKILENYHLFSECVCMVQKEVAERIAAPPGNKTYGILSVLLQTWFNIEYLFTVHENSFYPPPRVKSAVIRLTRNKRDTLNCDLKLYQRVIKQSFNQRRKTLRNSLRNISVNLNDENEIFRKRPEQLSVEEFISLTQLIDKSISNQE